MARAMDDARPVESANKRPEEQRREVSLPTVWLVGDSTVRVGTKGQRGWGEELSAFFDLTKVNVVNRAIGGRSSRTFQTEGRWDRVLQDLRPGDFVVIQFGHNDGGAINDDSRARGSLRGLGEEIEEINNRLTKKHEVVHTFGWYLRKYVADTKARGAVPILCTLVPRKIWRDGRIARDRETYAGWTRQVAEAAGVPCLDLNEGIALAYERLGPEGVAPFFADERTHTTAAGARFSAEQVIAAMKAQPVDLWAALYSDAGRAVSAFRQGQNL